MKRLFIIISVFLITTCLIVSCSPEVEDNISEKLIEKEDEGSNYDNNTKGIIRKT